ncbi:MAG: protein kinase, partial [Bryobacteraceae bacterium]
MVRLIARGGMGEVFEALDAEEQTQVAIKAIRSDVLSADVLQRFKKEVQVSKQVTHPNVCRVYDLFRHSGERGPPIFIISMELLRGETLARRLRRVRRLSTREALPLVLQIASALEAAHTAGILHRDLKPENVMLVPAEQGVRAVVMDFGVALRAESSIANSESAILTGTPAYMSPEQLEGRELTPASDIYALGLMMYRMLTGSHAYAAATTTSMALKCLSESPSHPRELVPDLEPHWETAILRCLEREPSCRYSSARSVADALGSIEIFPTAHRFGLYVALTIIVLLSIATGGSLIWNSRPKTEERVVSSTPLTSYTPLTNDGRPKDGPLLANRQTIFFMEKIGASWKIMSVPVSGGEPVAMAVQMPSAALVDISRDGSVLLLRSYQKGEEQLWAYPVAGGEPGLLAIGQEHGGWGPDGKAIVMSYGNVLSIARIGRAGTIHAVTLPGPIYTPRWSPDGSRIRFGITDARADSKSLWESDANGNYAHRLSSISNGPSTATGIWSRDGKYFFYEGGTTSHQQLWAIPESTKRGWEEAKAIQLTGGPGSWTWPAISPTDSTLFAFHESTRSNLVRLDLESGSWKPEWDGVSAYELDFSRDGKWVTYADPDHAIWKARPDASERVRLTDRTLEAHEPHWSPDGRQIAMMAKKKTGEWRVFCIPSGGGQPQELLPKGE